MDDTTNLQPITQQVLDIDYYPDTSFLSFDIKQYSKIPLLSPAPGQRCILCSGLCGIRSQDGKVFAWISFCSESVKASVLEGLRSKAS